MDRNFFRNTDAAVILSESNLYYFTKYNNTDAAVLMSPDKRYYVTDARTAESAKESLTDFEIVICENGNYVQAVAQLCQELSVTTICYEDETILYKQYMNLKLAGKELVPMSQRISDLRAIKDDTEISYIVKAQEITDRVYSTILDIVKPGITELELANKINSLIYAHGCSLAFNSIVAFGKNTAQPHSIPGSTVLNKVDVVLIDFGAKYKGYCSDMTRCFAVGKVDPNYKKVYEAVLSAQKEVFVGLRPGITGQEADALARNYLTNVGYGDNFTHSTGHGVGIDIHESPRLSTYSVERLTSQNVFTVEPGVYFPGKFGIRIEDMVRLENNSLYNLTNSSKSLFVL
ncbi:MAG: aminopeptidase P family protein [Christensenellaceae bacterium]|jgi:Xaa-Pro aminopeptidase|nr:aminopeptidase P family protein [Christensenellaceae bacterium]